MPQQSHIKMIHYNNEIALPGLLAELSARFVVLTSDVFIVFINLYRCISEEEGGLIVNKRGYKWWLRQYLL